MERLEVTRVDLETSWLIVRLDVNLPDAIFLLSFECSWFGELAP